MPYQPSPIDTSRVTLSDDLLKLTEKIAASTHDNWAALRFKDGWSWGEKRDDAAKTHPSLVPYDVLSEAEKEYDRLTAMETLKAIITLGFKIEPAQ